MVIWEGKKKESGKTESNSNKCYKECLLMEARSERIYICTVEIIPLQLMVINPIKHHDERQAGIIVALAPC